MNNNAHAWFVSVFARGKSPEITTSQVIQQHQP